MEPEKKDLDLERHRSRDEIKELRKVGSEIKKEIHLLRCLRF